MTTTTIEAKATTRIPAARPLTERAVFVTDDDYRSRRLRQAAIAGGALACLWLAGLGIGTLGLGGLPGFSLPIPGGGGGQPARPADRPNDVTRAQARPAPRLATARESSGAAAAVRTHSSGRNQARPARATPPVTVPASPVAQGPRLPTATNQPAQPTPQPIRRGLERRGLSAPPGQAQRETRPQPAPEPPGQARRLNDPATAPAPVPPAQQKPDKPPPDG